ncbi:hypothetical protein Cus16_1953 [Curtobacterium sp. ER1/6]|nr:hypothetical protein Cus16_1953 [Curtobacterium sp. ER1/6]
MVVQGEGAVGADTHRVLVARDGGAAVGRGGGGAGGAGRVLVGHGSSSGGTVGSVRDARVAPGGARVASGGDGRGVVALGGGAALADAPVGHLGSRHGEAVGLRGRQAGCVTDRAVDVLDRAAHRADDVMVVVAGASLVPRRAAGGLDAADEPDTGQGAEHPVHRLVARRGELGRDRAEDVVRGGVRHRGRCAQHREARCRDPQARGPQQIRVDVHRVPSPASVRLHRFSCIDQDNVNRTRSSSERARRARVGAPARRAPVPILTGTPPAREAPEGLRAEDDDARPAASPGGTPRPNPTCSGAPGTSTPWPRYCS